MIKAQLSQKITSNSTSAFTLYDKSRFGEKKAGKIEYSPIEALHLVHEKKLQILQKDKPLTQEQLLKKLKAKDKTLETKLPAYSDLRKKGYVVKTALKFGADFRVYQKGIKPGQDHALWLVHVVKESQKISWQDFSAKNRVAHSTKKKLLIAVIDDEDAVTYYEVAWKKP